MDAEIERESLEGPSGGGEGGKSSSRVVGVTGTGSREEVGWGRLKADEIGARPGRVLALCVRKVLTAYNQENGQ